MKIMGIKNSGGEGGIRTPGTGFSQYNGLANRRIQPLCHLSAEWFQQLTMKSKFKIGLLAIYWPIARKEENERAIEGF